MQVGWICQALAAIGMPYSPTIFFTSNGMGKIFFWVFAIFPWNPLTKAVLDMSAAAANTMQKGVLGFDGAAVVVGCTSNSRLRQNPNARSKA
jgi:hypothetical protein